MNGTKRVPNGTPLVAVLGAGTIGASWSALFLSRGLKVNVYDPAPGAVIDVRRFVTSAWPTLEALGPVEGGWEDRLQFFATAEQAVPDAQFIQENVPSD